MNGAARSPARCVVPRPAIVSAGLAAAISVACSLGGNPETPAPSEPVASQATPYASEPAAGICAEAAGAEVVMRLEPGIPDPRCMIVVPSQTLRVVNLTGAAVTVSLGDETYPLEADGEVVFETPFGQALMPGVHVLLVDPCCGGELWLKAE